MTMEWTELLDYFCKQSLEHGMKVWAFRHAYTTVAEVSLRETDPEVSARCFPWLALLKVCMGSLSYSAGM